MERQFITLSYNLPPGGGVKIYEEKPLTKGIIRELTIHWPDGCNGLVSVAVWCGTFQLFPKRDFIALNDATPKYEGFSHPKTQDEEFWVDMNNADAANSHRISVTVGIDTD
jgi:hypothetical protein